MHPDRLREMLSQLGAGELTVADAVDRLRHLPFEQLAEASVDHHRELRQGVPEVIFGAGKTPEQVAAIARALLGAGSNVLCTRAAADAFAAVQQVAPDASFDALGRTIRVVRKPPRPIGRVGVVCAGTSDLPVAREAVVAAEFFGAEVALTSDVGVAGLHRLLGSLEVVNASDVLIVVAGMEGALPSVVGGLVAQPIVAVPTSVGYGVSLGGLTALFAMLSACASGITVVNIDNGFGAAAAAHRILAGRPTASRSAAGAT